MIINIDMPLLQDKVMEVLENDEMEYKYLGKRKGSNLCLQYEVDEAKFPMDPVLYTRKLVRKVPLIKSVFYRILEDGKQFD